MNKKTKINTALLSYGMSGKVFHAPFLELHPGFELIGAWERSKKLINADFPLVKSYSSLEEILQDESVDLVIINTPVDTHFDFAKQVLLAGKHALVEKAFTATVAEAEALFEIAEENNVCLTVFQNRRFDSDFKTVREIHEKNILGEIVEAEIHFDRFAPNLSSKQHKESSNPGAGILLDLGPHIIDQAICLFGFPVGIHADIRKTRDNSLIDDWFDITLHYPNSRVRLKAGYFVREPLPAYIIHGKIGSFIKSRGDVQEDDLKSGFKPLIIDWGIEPEYKSGVLNTQIEGVYVRENVATLRGNYYYFFDELFRYIKNGDAAPIEKVEAINVMRIIEMAVKSSKEKQYLKF